MSDQGIAPPPERQFSLIIAEHEKRFVLKFENEGVTLGNTGLVWTCDGIARTKHLSEIATIHLRVLPTTGALTGRCRITFDDGTMLDVMSSGPTGFADIARVKTYREFVAALHRELSPADRARIAFSSGYRNAAATWRAVGIVALIAAVMLFVVTPLGLALIFHDQRGYGLALGGASLTYFLYAQWRRNNVLNSANTPQTYAPDRIPAALLP